MEPPLERVPPPKLLPLERVLLEELWLPKLPPPILFDGADCLELVDPNERLLLFCGVNVRLGVASLLAPKWLPKEEPLLLGRVAVVRVLLWRGVPNERVPLVAVVVFWRLLLVLFCCEPSERLLRNGLSLTAPLLMFPNERLPVLLLPFLLTGTILLFCGEPAQERLPGS